MRNLSISYLKHGERLITDGDTWIICHPEDGEIIASSGDEDTAHEMFAEGEIFNAKVDAVTLTEEHLSPGLRDSIEDVWG